MEKILDKLEAVARRWLCLITLAIFLFALSLFVLLSVLFSKPVYDLANGACYCPKCGAVMVLGDGEVSE